MGQTRHEAMQADAESDFPTEPGRSRPHWIVGTHHRLRSASFFNSFVFCAVHMWGLGYGPLAWGGVALLFLVYPHLAWWRACRADDTQRAELQNLLLDCLLAGLCVGALGLPLWITFTLFISTAINNAITQGLRGIALALGLFAAGALVGSASQGFVPAPPSSGWVTALCVFGLTWYLLGVGHVAWLRARALRTVRERLKRGEQALHAANDNLRVQLQQIRDLQAQLQDQANRDPLTGLYNRRYLQATIDRELARCRRDGTPLCVMVIDIDHFKRVNDAHGHQVGDEVLCRLARLLSASARQGDVACRYGGEEFLMLLPRMPLDVAVQRAQRWCDAFAAGETATPTGNVRCTLSIGIAAFPEHGDEAETLTRHADDALYAAKAHGRNRVVVATAAQPA